MKRNLAFLLIVVLLVPFAYAQDWWQPASCEWWDVACHAGNVWNGVVDTGSSAFDWATDTVSGGVGWVAEQTGSVGSGALDFVSDSVGWVGETTGGASSGVLDFVSGGISGAVDTVSSGVGWVAEQISDVGSGALDFVGDIGGGAIDTIFGGVGWIGEQGSKALDTADKWLNPFNTNTENPLFKTGQDLAKTLNPLDPESIWQQAARIVTGEPEPTKMVCPTGTFLHPTLKTCVPLTEVRVLCEEHETFVEDLGQCVSNVEICKQLGLERFGVEAQYDPSTHNCITPDGKQEEVPITKCKATEVDIAGACVSKQSACESIRLTYNSSIDKCVNAQNVPQEESVLCPADHPIYFKGMCGTKAEICVAIGASGYDPSSDSCVKDGYKLPFPKPPPPEFPLWIVGVIVAIILGIVIFAYWWLYMR